MLFCALMVLTLAFVVLPVAAAVALWWISRRWQRCWKVLGRTGSLALMAWSAFLVLLYSFGAAMCGHYDFPAVVSPDGLKTASVSEEDCGATDSFHSSVQLWERNSGVSTIFTI